MAKNIHIGYGDSATGCLLEAIKDHGLPGDGALPSRDDFTQGPISDCLDSIGKDQRITYWESVGRTLNFKFNSNDFYKESIKILEEIETDEITIWVGDSCHDILATGWLLNYFKQRNFNWLIVNLAELNPSDLPNGIPAVNLAMYAPNEICKLNSYRRPMKKEDVEYYISIWQKACTENSHYRVLSGNTITSVGEDYYDDYILSHIIYDMKPCNKIIGTIMKDGQFSISDTTIEWNIRKMISRGWIEFEGELKSMNDYQIKIIKD